MRINRPKLCLNKIIHVYLVCGNVTVLHVGWCLRVQVLTGSVICRKLVDRNSSLDTCQSLSLAHTNQSRNEEAETRSLQLLIYPSGRLLNFGLPD